MAQKPRRQYGTGAIYQVHKPDGPWRVAFSFGTDGRGRRVRQQWQCRSDKAARAKLKEVTDRLNRGLPAKESPVTVAAYADEWLLAVQSVKSQATYDQYRHLIRHVIVEFGHLRLTRVTPRDLRELIAKRQSQGYASRTIRGIVDTFRVMSRQAMNDGILSRNVAELVDKPQLVQKEPRHFTAAQAKLFLEVASEYGGDLHSLYAVALGTGLRRSELLALSWRDIDLDRGTVTVRRSKTTAGLRVVPLPSFAADALGEVERRPGPIWQVSKWSVSRRMGQLCERAGLPRLGMHSLRHSAASLMLAQGVPPLVIQQILGHTTVKMTGHYARSDLDMQRDAMERLGRAVG